MIFNNWVLYIASALYAILLGVLAVLLIINADQRATIATADATRALLQSQNEEWARKTIATNAALDKIKMAAVANAKAIAKAEIAAAKAGQKFKTQAAAIAAFARNGSDCDQVLALRKTYLELWP